MADCNSTAAILEWAIRQQDRIAVKSLVDLINVDPYTTSMGHGTYEPNQSEVMSEVINTPAAYGSPLDAVAPIEKTSKEWCDEFPEEVTFGTKKISWVRREIRQVSQYLCFGDSLNAFKETFANTEASFRQLITRLETNRNRKNLLDLSGSKTIVTTKAKSGIDSTNTIQIPTGPVPFPVAEFGQPDARPTLMYLKGLARAVQEQNDLAAWTEKNIKGISGTKEQVIRVVTSFALIEQLRNDADIKTSYNYIASGGFDVGKDFLLNVSWEGPYQGLGFKVDRFPLRASAIPEDGIFLTQDFIPPYINVPVEGGEGYRSVINPEWQKAPIELGFIFVQENAVIKLSDTNSKTIGNRTLPNLPSPGKVEFRSPNGRCDDFGDKARYIYRNGAAYRPKRAEGIIVFAYNRGCQGDAAVYCD